ncbi:hypothetical protein CVS40_12843 [Lucilia cuprina]|nr:hypothetical protein CVS40_12843 [Lucilia cuprina]
MAIVSGRIPLLNGKNFSTWYTQMEAIFHKNRLLRMVRGEEPKQEVVVINSNATAAERTLYDNYLKKQREYDDVDHVARTEIITALEPDIVRMVKNMQSRICTTASLQERRPNSTGN